MVMGIGQAFEKVGEKLGAAWGSSRTAAAFTGIQSTVRSSPIYRELWKGTKETVGFRYSKAGASRGFLGLGSKPFQTAARLPGAFIKTGMKQGWKKASWKLARHGVGRLFVPGLTLAFAAQAFKEEGLWGATKTVAEFSAFQAGFNNLGKIARFATSPIGIGIAAVAAGGYGYYKFGEAAQKHGKRLKGLEFATASMDLIGSAGALTDRARSIQALNQSHLNGRIALGNEALLTHSSY